MDLDLKGMIEMEIMPYLHGGVDNGVQTIVLSSKQTRPTYIY
jgi:hypothetical protein